MYGESVIRSNADGESQPCKGQPSHLDVCPFWSIHLLCRTRLRKVYALNRFDFHTYFLSRGDHVELEVFAVQPHNGDDLPLLSKATRILSCPPVGMEGASIIRGFRLLPPFESNRMSDSGFMGLLTFASWWRSTFFQFGFCRLSIAKPMSQPTSTHNYLPIKIL